MDSIPESFSKFLMLQESTLRIRHNKPSGPENNIRELIQKFRRYIERGLDTLTAAERQDALRCKTAIQEHLDKK